ncbi:MAG: hypothetical protein GF308_02765 [Candidatus Heimdallarchaeota archaeon]|nr:hypothetical protein [Candidatus Heimdallarchaeota archaeon]
MCILEVHPLSQDPYEDDSSNNSEEDYSYTKENKPEEEEAKKVSLVEEEEGESLDDFLDVIEEGSEALGQTEDLDSYSTSSLEPETSPITPKDPLDEPEVLDDFLDEKEFPIGESVTEEADLSSPLPSEDDDSPPLPELSSLAQEQGEPFEFDAEKEAAAIIEETEDQTMLRMRYEAIDEHPTPFEEFVARHKTPIKVDIPDPHENVKKALMIKLKAVQRDRVPRIFPIIGEAGSGKTHFYWHLKDLEKKEDANWTVVYIPSPPSSVRIPLHIFTCILDEIGNELITRASGEIMRRFSEKGFFKRNRVRDIVQRAIPEYPGLKAEIVSALAHIGQGDKHSLIARRWILGGWISEKELDQIGTSRLIEADDLVMAAIKVLLENYHETVVLYFDEIEIPYRTRGVDVEVAFLENLKRFYNEVANVLLVAACLKEIWPRIYETLDSALRTRMGNIMEFEPFTIENIKEFYIRSMNRWWIEEQNIDPPKDPLFPLTETDFEKIYQTSEGNPRLCIKLIRSFLTKAVAIGLSKEAPPEEDLQKLTAKEAPLSALLGTDISIEVNPPSVAAGMVETIVNEGRQRGIVIGKQENPEFLVEGKSQSIAALLQFPDFRLGLEVASVKNFDRKGGVAAYYALDRLRQAIEHGFIDRGVLAVPYETSGSKYEMMLFQLGNRISVLELDREEGQKLIQAGLLGELSNKGLELIKKVFPR